MAAGHSGSVTHVGVAAGPEGADDVKLGMDEEIEAEADDADEDVELALEADEEDAGEAEGTAPFIQTWGFSRSAVFFTAEGSRRTRHEPRCWGRCSR